MFIIRQILLFLLVPGVLFAQQVTDSVLVLPDVEIRDQKLDKQLTGYKSEVLVDSTNLLSFRSYNLGDLLSQNTPVYVKAYSPGGIATVSFRGTSASQTGIFWNGLNIQSQMLGQTDFSLLPVGFANRVNLQFGSSSTYYGSGAVGGTIQLNNSPEFNKGTNIGLSGTAASFGTYQESIKASYSNKKAAFSVNAFNQSSQNDFSYKSKSQAGEQKMANADYSLKGILAESYFKLKNQHTLGFRIWYQDADKNLPANTAAKTSTSNLKDNNLRLMGDWSKSWLKTTLTGKLAYLIDKEKYKDTLSGIYGNHQTNNLIAEIEVSHRFTENQALQLKINDYYFFAQSTNYEGIPGQNRNAASLIYKLNNRSRTVNMAATLRSDVVDGQFQPVCPGLGLEWQTFKWLSFYGNASRHFRLPTFNDLYWNPGGNPNLKAEQGWTQEVGTKVKNKSEKAFNYLLGFTFYNSRIENWIQWQPQGSLWTPVNLREVWARGTETSLKLSYKQSSWNISLATSVNYTLSTTEASNTYNDNSIGMQLVYVPMYSSQNNLGIGYKKLNLNYSLTYTGYRFTSSDNTEILDPYLLHNIQTSYALKVAKLDALIFFHVNNIFNESYEAMENRPMPGRNFRLGINLNLNIKTKNS